MIINDLSICLYLFPSFLSNSPFKVDCKVLGRKGGERTLLLFEKMLLFLKKLKSETGYIYKGLIKVRVT